MSIYPLRPSPKPHGRDRAMLDRTAEALGQTFGLDGAAQGSWGNWSHLGELLPSQPAFVLRRTPESVGLSLDTQRWDISGGARCWPTTWILSVSLPWWRRLATRPAQRCLIPVTACAAPLPPRDGRDGRSGWFTMVDEPVFTIAGLWRDTGDARCFAMLACPTDGPFPVMPVVIAAGDRATWLDADWDAAAPLMTAVGPERVRIGLSEDDAPFYAEEHVDRHWDRPPADLATRSVTGY
ncbi:hypothetical protein [uncultured Sphingomonas sp.]|uniref:hypothetical protein n=1 Tax=uncultured Sphingomonas sp. TaxID=158754 RepID=UPI0037497C04